jgi:endonuclease YncB( thermonuclease family)
MKQSSRGVTPDDIYIYKISDIIRIIDGDTIEIFIELGFDVYHREKIRLLGFDAPETFRPKTEEEKIGGEKVKEYLISLLKDEENLYIKTKKKGKYGRYLGIILKKENNLLISINDEVKLFMEKNNLTKKELRSIKIEDKINNR